MIYAKLPVRVALAALLAGAAVAPVLAHHSVTSEYDTSKVVTLDGEVQTLELASPHSRLTLDVKGPGGTSTSRQTELPSVAFLHRAGWTEASLRSGEHIHLTAAPSRSDATRLYAISITKADGSHLALLPAVDPAAGGKQ
jgi:Family of unknown function (DUF6152)